MAQRARSANSELFDIECRLCTRLSEHLAAIRETRPEYYSKPVPAFGPKRAVLHIVGLAPGLHGANRTGRAFTGDGAGSLLYRTLHSYGLSTQPLSEHRRDGLRLKRCRITNAVKCLPPQNRPTNAEMRLCNTYLRAELAMVPKNGVILALGALAHRAVLLALDLKPGNYHFAHGSEFSLNNGRWLVDSYHCSRYNTQTKRLTEAMFRSVVERAYVLSRL